MPDDPSRTAARSLLNQAAATGVAPLMLGGSMWAVRDHRELLPRLLDAQALAFKAGLPQAAAHEAEQRPSTGAVAVIPLTGIITPQGSMFDFLFGGAPGGLAGFRTAMTEAMNSPDISAIVIDVDSPGGLVDLVPETAEFVREARGNGKPIIAVADTMMASAAYWIASQADEVVITPSGRAGSIGVYRVHTDFSRANAQDGVTVTYVSAGKFKTEGNPDAPLDSVAEAQWQADVDAIYESFVADVAAGRGVSTEVVVADFGEGRTLRAGSALEAGLVDRIATYEQVVGGLLGAAGSHAQVHAGTGEPPTIGSLPVGAPVFTACRADKRRCETQAACLAHKSCMCTEPSAVADPDPEPPIVGEPDDLVAELDALTDDERALVAALLLAV